MNYSKLKILMKITLATILVFVFFVFTKYSDVYAQCAAGDYCSGSTAQDYPNGCNIYTCVTAWLYGYFTCPNLSTCNAPMWGEKCSSSSPPCSTVATEYDVWCCVISGGGGGGGGGGGCSCDTAAGPPTLNSPAANASFTPTTTSYSINFSWSPGTWGEDCCDSRGYRLEVYKPDGTLAHTPSNVNSSTTQQNVSIIPYVGTHSWKVRQFNQEGGNWSGSRYFTINNTPPVCGGVTGSNTVRSPGALDYSTLTKDYVGLYRVNYSDVNIQEVRTTLNSPSCSMQLPTIKRINVRARSDFYLEWPKMRILTGNNASSGSRVQRCELSIANATYSTYSCDVGASASSIDIAFPNDLYGGSGLDSNLFIDWIEIVYNDDSITRIESDNALVIYDRPTNFYDGITTQAGQEGMFWGGSLRFPVPATFTAEEPTICDLRAAVRDTSGDSAFCVKNNIAMCGAVPSPVTGGAPNDERDVLITPNPPTLTWTPLADWGETCGASTNTYHVYVGSDTNDGNSIKDCRAKDPVGCTSGCFYNHVCQGSATECEDSLFNVRNREFCWYVEASNGEYRSQSDVWWFETDDPLLYQYWFTSLGGSAWLGGELMMNFPDSGDHVEPWKPPYFVYELDDPPIQIYPIALNVNDEVDIQGDGEESESSLWATEVSAGNQWPQSYKGIPSTDDTTVDLKDAAGDDCLRIFNDVMPDPSLVYKADVACISQAVNNAHENPTDGYRLNADGTAVIYVTGSGDFEITNGFIARNSNMKIVFVTGPEVRVVIDEDLELVGNPTRTSDALVEAAFVITSDEGILFEGVLSTGDDPEDNPDGTTVIEGPIITKSFNSDRSRALTNYYPYTIIRYSPKYLYQLTKQERESGMSNYTGLFNIDVQWELME